jgi:cytochrome c oxidase subunit 3/cytochrome o ubiquinol oxidase subunit 3
MAQTSAIAADPMTIARDWQLPDRGNVGILMLILTEAVLFAMFVVAYIVYSGQSIAGPYPKDVLNIPILSTVCLLTSSLTIVLAEDALKHGNLGNFRLWWLATIALGAEFITATFAEWRHLIVDEHLTITTNLFGTTYYSLVGLHATHVIVGLIFLMLVMIATLLHFDIEKQARRIKLLSWYWHFVDAVWVVVFTVVYIIGR